MSRFLRTVLALAWKDILLELRSRDMVVSVLLFGFLVILVFNFALKPTPRQVPQLAPAILWVSFVFAGTLMVERAFVREREQGGLEGLLLTPVSRDAIFLGKAFTSFLFMLMVEGVLLALLALLLNFSPFSVILLATLFLATLGFATVGTLFSAMAVQTRAREVMLPVLFFPIILPVLVGAVEVTSRALAGEGAAAAGRWLPLIGVFDALFLVICPWAFGAVMEE